ncbi:hypothetical protein CDAR_18481 [Caerostris darwini]|uniref:Uncharacterized protein n=1 Tax=Caerostris darwini TaxID=1538125 RepID=A0AAV4V8Z1_9ARAC|nr:hypothetical protein CDAR_18481 [Caerostris darwini]
MLLPLSIPPVRLKREADRGTCTKAGHYPSHPRMRQEKEEACERNPPPSGKLIKIRDAHLHDCTREQIPRALLILNDAAAHPLSSSRFPMEGVYMHGVRQTGWPEDNWEDGRGEGVLLDKGALLALQFEDGFLK